MQSQTSCSILEAMSAYLLHKRLKLCHCHITVSFIYFCGGGQGNSPLLYAGIIGSGTPQATRSVFTHQLAMGQEASPVL